jgi:hypothetical protein
MSTITKYYVFRFFLTFFTVLFLIPVQAKVKPRVVILTDIGVQDMKDQKDRDDIQSLVRLLVYSNELDIEGLIATKSRKNSIDMHNSSGNIIDVFPETIIDIVKAYGKVRDNLILHDPEFPSEEYLLSNVKAGNPVKNVSWSRGNDMNGVGAGKNTAASDHIVSILQKEDPRPVWFCVWGKSIDLAQALWDIRETGDQDKLKKIISKIRVYDIAGQDAVGGWIAHTFPDIFWIRALQQFKGFGDTKLIGNDDIISDEWADEHIRSHGPLGEKYIVNHRSKRSGGFHFEGDSPSFLYLVNPGLSDPENPHYGCWGGRFTEDKVKNISCRWSPEAEKQFHDFWMYAETVDTWHYQDTTYQDNVYAPVARWREDFQNDFAARMDWCMQSFKKANHQPIAVINGDHSQNILQLNVECGQTTELRADNSYDPDDDKLLYEWYLYPELGTYQGELIIKNNFSGRIEIKIPMDMKGQNAHLILEVSDINNPPLNSYRRIVLWGV